MQFKKEYANLTNSEKCRILKQYKLEIKYATKLKNTPNPERASLYKILYDVNATLSLVMNPTNIHQKKRQNEEIEKYYSFMFNN